MDFLTNIISGVAVLVLLKTLYDYAMLTEDDKESERIVERLKELERENARLKEKLKQYEKD